MSQHTEQEHQRGLAVEEARPEVARPPLYQVVILNDDFTPMEFVVAVLETFFSMNREVAETKVTQVNEFSRSHQHPLLCTLEKA